MESNLVYASFILDESGSMNSCFNQTVEGFNGYIESLLDEEDSNKIRFTLTKFNSMKTNVEYNGILLMDVPILSRDNYNPTGGTPLYDAIGKTINSLSKNGNKNLVVIQTDGEENCSSEFTFKDITKLMKDRTDEGWTFVFLGADQDAWETGRSFGISSGNIMSYASSDTSKMYNDLSRATACFAYNGGGQQTNEFFTESNTEESD